MTLRFSPPPNWPKPPEGFTPPPGWKPDPAWGPAPEGWVFWVDDSQDAASPANPYLQGVGAATSASSANSYPTDTSQPAPSFAQPGQSVPGQETQASKSKTPLIIGAIAAVVVLFAAIAIGATAILLSSASKTNQAGSASVATTSSATSTPAEATDSSSATASASSSASTAPVAGQPLSTTDFQKAVEKATPLPTTASSKNVKEYTADNIKNTIKDAEPGQYMFGAQRPANNTALAWAELIFTPSEEGTGYFMESRTTRLNDKGESAEIEGHEMELKWDEAGKEYRHTFWLGPIIEGRNDIFEIDLPEGSQWKLRIHPADQAPTITGAVTANTSGAFYYKPTDGHSAEFAVSATTDSAGAELMVYIPDSPTGDYLATMEAMNRDTAQASKVTLPDLPVRIPINVTSTGTSWVFNPNP